MRLWLWIVAASAVVAVVGCGPGGRRVADVGPPMVFGVAWVGPVCADTASPGRVFARDPLRPPDSYRVVDVPGHGGDVDHLLRTVAHELGHGAFGLEHLESRCAAEGYTGGGTDGLMEGAGRGEHLHKFEWDLAHNPEIRLPGSGADDNAASRELAPMTAAEEAALAEQLFELMDGDTTLERLLGNLEALVEYVATTPGRCGAAGWGSYKGKGIVPACLWEEVPVDPLLRYQWADLAFQAGVIDGVYQEAEGLVKLPGMLVDLAEGTERLISSYLRAYSACRLLRGDLPAERMRAVVERLAAKREASSGWSWVEQTVTPTTFRSYEMLECAEAEALVGEVNEFVALIADREVLAVAYEKVSAEVSKYFEKVSDFGSNYARYEHGRVGIQVAATFGTGGAAAVTKVTKVRRLLEAMRRFTRGQWDDWGRKVGRRLDEATPPRAGPAGAIASRLRGLGLSDEAIEELANSRTAEALEALAVKLEATPGLARATEAATKGRRGTFADDAMAGGDEFARFFGEGDELTRRLEAWEAFAGSGDEVLAGLSGRTRVLQRFLDEFGGSPGAMAQLKTNPGLLRTWERAGDVFRRAYPGADAWPTRAIDDAFRAEARAKYGDDVGDLVDEVHRMEITGGGTVGAGAYHPSLPKPSESAVTAVNFKRGEVGSGVAERFLQDLHPILKRRIEYLEFLDTYKLIKAPAQSIDKAGKFGVHAEFRVLDRALKEVERAEGMTPGSFPADRLGEFTIFVKARARPSAGRPFGTNAPRCVCCWHGTHGIDVVGNK